MEENNKIKVGLPLEGDFEELYSLGLSVPEIQTSLSEPFMDRDEFLWSLNNTSGIFLSAKVDGKVVGFIYANIRDTERPMPGKWACIVELAVDLRYRRIGVGGCLYNECLKRLKECGVSQVFTWANTESDQSIINFMEKQGFVGGKKYLWMDKRI